MPHTSLMPLCRPRSGPIDHLAPWVLMHASQRVALASRGLASVRVPMVSMRCAGQIPMSCALKGPKSYRSIMPASSVDSGQASQLKSVLHTLSSGVASLFEWSGLC